MMRSGVIGNTLGFDPRDSRFDPWLRSLRTWPNGTGACFRNKSMRVRVLPSALFEYGSVAQMDQSACLRNRRPLVRVQPESLRFVGLGGYDSGLVNRRRWFESSTKLWEVQEGSGFGVRCSESRVPGSEFSL